MGRREGAAIVGDGRTATPAARGGGGGFAGGVRFSASSFLPEVEEGVCSSVPCRNLQLPVAARVPACVRASVASTPRFHSEQQFS
ncbi:unnamed protein product [Lampetra fluviatilis]